MSEVAEQETTSYGFAPAIPKNFTISPTGMLFLPPPIYPWQKHNVPNEREFGGINMQTRAVLAVTLVLVLGALFSTHCSEEPTSPEPTIPWSAGIVPHLRGKEWDTSGEPKPTTKALLADLWDPTPSPQAIDVVPTGIPEQSADSINPTPTPTQETKIGSFSYTLKDTATGFEVWDPTGLFVLCYYTFNTEKTITGTELVTIGDYTFLRVTWEVLLEGKIISGNCPIDPSQTVLVFVESTHGLYPSFN